MKRRSSNYSRLSKRERNRYGRQTAFYTLLTIAVIAVIVFWGIPSLVKVAIFLGEVKSSGQPISGKDEIPPPPPVLQPLPDATASASLRVEGYAEEEATIILSVNGRDAYETVVESNGEFLIANVLLNAGENIIYAKAVDAAGNESSPSTTYEVIQDNEAPKLVVTSPTAGQKFYGVSEKNVHIVGSVDADTTVRINNSLVIISLDGKFSHTLSLSPGTNIIRVVAKDRADNETVTEIEVSYEE